MATTSPSAAVASTTGQRASFFPKADAAVLLAQHNRQPPPPRPSTVGPIFDPQNVDRPIGPLSNDAEKIYYPLKTTPFAPSPVPDKPSRQPGRYLRATLAKNERLRLSMLWYYTWGILDEPELLSGLQEKADLAQESSEWEYAVIGILDVNFYVRLATVRLPLAILPRGETLCAHTVVQPPGSVFLLPDMMEDWRFRESPYVECGGLKAYAGVPLRLQHESGECVGLGSLCVASATGKDPLNRMQQQTLARLADWVVSDIIQCARARRQRERRHMSELVSTAQQEMENCDTEEPITKILSVIYPNAAITLQSSKAGQIEVEGRAPVPLSDLHDGSWEDVDYIDDVIANSNQRELPTDKVVRIIAAPCDTVMGPSLLLVASKDFRLVFDDVDSWFVQTCAGLISQAWHQHLLSEALKAKEKFLRGFSHQLRTPIHGILGSVELLAEELKCQSLREASEMIAAAAEPLAHLDTIKTSGRDLIAIVNSMITLNRWADIAMTDRTYAVHTLADIETELANEVNKSMSGDTRYQPSVFFQHNPPPDYDSIRIDLALLRDSVLPLIINAIQYTSKGIVTVTISIRPAGKELVVDVEDTGRGVHPDDQQHIFEPYEKAGEHSMGAGLGLTLSSKFATLLHGSVALVSSQIDGGSHFRATFKEVECLCCCGPPQPLASKLRSMPGKFHTLCTNPEGSPLSSNFARFLRSQDFSPSDDKEGCFVILDYVSNVDQHRLNLAEIPSDQVAICLIPASEDNEFLEPTPHNVVYMTAPFLTSTMSSALVEGDKLLSTLKTSQKPLLEDVNTPPTPPELELPAASVPHGDGELTHNPSESAFRVPRDIITPPTPDPMVDMPLASASNLSDVPALSMHPRPTTLLVDDNAINLRVMQAYCRKRKLPFFCATDGKQAVELYQQHQLSFARGESAGIQLVLMDLQMPVCDGIEATRQIRSLEKENKWNRSSLLIVTGQDSPKDRKDAESVGADDFFVKPVGIKVLDRGIGRYFPSFEAS